MAKQKYHPPVDKLLGLGDPRDMGAEWPNYLKMGLSREHIPELLSMLEDNDLLNAMSDTLEVWAPVHAWRILGQLHAVEAVDALLGQLKQIDTSGDDWLLEEMPDVFGLIGPEALPALTAYLGNKEHGDSSRSCAAGGIAKIGQVSPEHRLDCVRIITAQLREYDQNSVALNGLLICDLTELHAIESIEVIRGAFQKRRVEIAIPGDLEDVEIELGLRKQRSTPQPRYHIFGESQQATNSKEKIGRNDPCPCGSGKKYKKCCLPQQEASRSAQTAQQHAGGDDASEMEEEPRSSTSCFTRGEETLWEGNSTPSLDAEADDWWKRYEAASTPDRYNLILATLRDQIPPEFLAQIELVEVLLDLQGELVGNGYVAEAVHLIGQIHSHLPEVYRKSYEYFDELLVTWHLFQNDPTGVGEGLRRFKEDPIAGIDSLIPVLKKLCFFGFTDQALLLCEETFDAVNNSPDLIGNTEGELAHCIYLARLGRIYAQYKQGVPVDWESLARGMDRYEMEISPELLARIQANLTGGPLDGERLIGAFGLHREEELANLAFGFFRYMHDEKNMDFPCSELIWYCVAEFLSERKSSVKGVPPDAFFGMTRAKLEPYLAGMIGGFLSRRQADAVAMLWGMPYIYDFLLDRRVISATTHRETIQIAAALKAEVIKGMGKRLWEFDFVHRWTPPDSVAKSEFADKAAMFQQTCTPAVSLAEYGGTVNRRLP